MRPFISAPEVQIALIRMPSKLWIDVRKNVDKPWAPLAKGQSTMDIPKSEVSLATTAVKVLEEVRCSPWVGTIGAHILDSFMMFYE